MKIFECKNSQSKYCLPNETQVCTKRFYNFMIDSEEIFRASVLTESEHPKAVLKYKKSGLLFMNFEMMKNLSYWDVQV